MSRRRNYPESISAVLSRLIKRLGIEIPILEHQVLVIWPEVVGKTIAAHTKAMKVTNGLLFVKTDSPVWSNELSFLKQDIIKGLNKKVGKRIIKDIRLRA